MTLDDVSPKELSLLLGRVSAYLDEGIFIAENTLRKNGLPILWGNRRLSLLTGYDEAELVGMAHGLLHPGKEARQRLADWLAHPGHPDIQGEGGLLRADGESIPCAWIFTALPAEPGGTVRIVGIYRDLSETKALRDKVDRMLRMETVGHLAAGLAHDFQNHISVINGYCELLADKLGSGNAPLKEVAQIQGASQRAAALVRQLLGIGRDAPSGQDGVDLNAIVSSNAAMLESLLSGRGRLVLNLGSGLGHAQGSAAQYQQVLLNLVLNARDALGDNGEVVLSTMRRELTPDPQPSKVDPPVSRHYLVLQVRDNGAGMDTDTLKHIFEPFFTTKEKDAGSGLGLPMVEDIVTAGGGFIQVESQPGLGSNIEILLPETQAPEDRVTAITHASRGKALEILLVIESDPVLRKMAEGILAAEGYRVRSAAQATEAVRQWKQDPTAPQLIIAPTAAECRKLAGLILPSEPRLRLLETAPDKSRQSHSWLPSGHFGMLPKPFALGQLLKAVRALLDA